MKACPVAGCERIPEPGWSRCRAHVEEWLDRVLLPDTRAATKAAGYERPCYEAPQGTAQDGREWDELELRAAYGDR